MIDPPASTQAAGQPAENGEPSPGAADLAAELARVRERLKFYESFDTLIRDNVLRSGELLREVAVQREETERKMLEMRAEVDQRLADQRTTLEDIAAGLSALQANLGVLAERVTSSLSALPDAGSVSLSEATLAGAGRLTLDSTVTERPSVSEAGRAVAPADAPTDHRVSGNGLSVPDLRVGEPPAPAIAATAQIVEPIAQRDAAAAVEYGVESTEPAAAAGEQGPDRRKIDLIVHGVPRAATALSLQRHLQELAAVEAVEVREYVSGVLRFQVVASTLGPDDFRAWQNGEGLEVVTARDNVLELKLPSAEGF